MVRVNKFLEVIEDEMEIASSSMKHEVRWLCHVQRIHLFGVATLSGDQNFNQRLTRWNHDIPPDVRQGNTGMPKQCRSIKFIVIFSSSQIILCSLWWLERLLYTLHRLLYKKRYYLEKVFQELERDSAFTGNTYTWWVIHIMTFLL